MWLPRRVCLTIAISTSVFTFGCSSIKSTLLQRDASNTGWTSLKTCGVPVTLKVTTHLRVTVTETRLYTLSKSKECKEWTPLLDMKGDPVTERTWAHEEIKTDKLFTVDFKRPAAGIVEYDAKFSNQYFTEISGKVQDNTIAEVSKAINGIIGVLPKGATSRTLGETGPHAPVIQRFPTVVAVAVFALDDPSWEVQMTDFLAQHLQGAAVGPGDSHDFVSKKMTPATIAPPTGDSAPFAGSVPPARTAPPKSPASPAAVSQVRRQPAVMSH